MRCSICDTLLDDFEVCRRYPKDHPREGQYLDTCTPCIVEIINLTDFTPDVTPSEEMDDSAYFIDNFE